MGVHRRQPREETTLFLSIYTPRLSIMGGGHMPETGKYAYKGIERYFNTHTLRDKLGILYFTFGTPTALYILNKMRKKRAASIAAKNDLAAKIAEVKARKGVV